MGCIKRGNCLSKTKSEGRRKETRRPVSAESVKLTPVWLYSELGVPPLVLPGAFVTFASAQRWPLAAVEAMRRPFPECVVAEAMMVPGKE